MIANVLEIEAKFSDLANDFIYLVFHLALSNSHSIDKEGIIHLLLSDALIVPNELVVVHGRDIAARFEALDFIFPSLTFLFLLRDLSVIVTDFLLECLNQFLCVQCLLLHLVFD